MQEGTVKFFNIAKGDAFKEMFFNTKLYDLPEELSDIKSDFNDIETRIHNLTGVWIAFVGKTVDMCVGCVVSWVF